jgi:protein-S-isoprenylcysteine O-methyltransferase Ste14
VKNDRRSFDPRRHSQQTQARLVVAGLALLFTVGGGLVWLLYGDAAAVSAVACLTVAVGLVGVLWLMLALLEKWVEKDQL